MKKTLLAILTAALVVCSVGLVACGHTCVYDQEIIGASTLAQAATCTSPAYYYYSCECGNVSADEMFEDGEVAAHVFTAETANDDTLLSSATCTAPAMYYKSCANCDAISTNMDDVFSSTDLLPHTYTAETVKDSAKKADATCQAPATYYKSCSICGEVSTNAEDVFETGSLANHNYDANNEYLCSFGCGCKKLSESRVGDDANTLYFFDKANGKDQVSSTYAIDFGFSTEVKFGSEAGSLVLANDATDKPTISWDMLNYQFNEGDYVVFYVYNDSNCDIVDISLGYTHRQRCYNGQWTMVLWKAEDVAAEGNGWSWLIGRNYNGDWKAMTSSTITGNVYFSKAKVYSASQVQDLTAIGDTDEYTIGNATLIGKPTITNGNYNEDPGAFNDDFFKNAYCVNGVFALNTNGGYNDQGKAAEQEIKMVFKFKEGYQITSNTYLYITVKGLDLANLTTQAFSSAGHFASFNKDTYNNISLYETLADGSQVYKLNLANYAGDATDLTSIRILDYKLKFPVTGQVVISDITVANS